MKHKLTLVLLSFFLGVQCMVAQQMKVTGVVINEDDGEPVIGASIVSKRNHYWNHYRFRW